MKLTSTAIVLLFLLQFGRSQKCVDFLYDEDACLKSKVQSCRWNPFTSQCLESSATNLGCNQILNQPACVSQLEYPDGSAAECLFSTFCRKVTQGFTFCAPYLSRAACLTVSKGNLVRCMWKNNQCQFISQADSQAYSSSATLTDALQLSSIVICQEVSKFACIHQSGAREVLLTLYRGTSLKSDSESKRKNANYKSLLSIPGCIALPEDIIGYLDCSSKGLNLLGCIAITSQKCAFLNGKCQTATNFEEYDCSYLSKLACLSVTNPQAPCQWLNSRCQRYVVSESTQCLITNVQISPSVCASIVNQECYFDSSTSTCNQQCRSTNNLAYSTVCTSSIYGCTWVNATCQFALTSQCGLQGQNQLSCMRTSEHCYFSKGHCKKINELYLFKCTDGLNKKACTELGNPSQVCKFTTTCSSYIVTPDMRCTELTDVNPIACRKITTEGCYWQNGNCLIANSSEVCTTIGLNKLGCLSTLNTHSPCTWNSSKGSCEDKVVDRLITCESLTLVNEIACRNVINRQNGESVICKYNTVKYACEVFTVDSTTQCSTPGLNRAACISVTDETKACRWLSNQCVEVTSLGSGLNCTSLQNVTYKTCALLQGNGEQCSYQTSKKGCSASVQPTAACTTNGLNPNACAFLTNSCYFNTTLNSCASTTVSILSTILCEANYPSKTACLNITTSGQYCKWNSINNLCEIYTFPTVKDCTDMGLTNKNLCLAYEISVSSWIQSDAMCTYNSAGTTCALYTAAASTTDCLQSADVNLHACVGKSAATKACYFDTTTLKCKELTDNSLLSSLSCKQGNKLTCFQITKAGEFCSWYSDAFQPGKCLNLTGIGGDCAALHQVNSNSCASITGATKCKWESNVASPSYGNCIVNANDAVNCSEPGLNEAACKASTSQPCYFDSSTKTCKHMSSTSISRQVNCSSIVNQKGCLAALGAACKWESGACAEITTITYTTATCASLDGGTIKYNAIVCAKVTTSGEYCAYDSVNGKCISQSIVSDCSPGYNSSNCNSDSCDFSTENYICSSKPAPPTNDCQGKNETDCLNTLTAACMYSGGSCVAVKINANMGCETFAAGSNKYNAATCMSIVKTGAACYYDATNKACLTVVGTNNLCTLAGINKTGCMLNTWGNLCKYESNLQSATRGCRTITDINQESCGSSQSKFACASMPESKGVCSFYVSNLTCYEEEVVYITSSLCSDYQNAANIVVNSSFCKHLIGTACAYDSTNKICKTATNSATCTTDTTINSVACLTTIQQQACTFSTSYACSQITEAELAVLGCTSAQTYKQCTLSALEPCFWNGTSCIAATINVACATLVNVNSIACMRNVNGTEKCQFTGGITLSTSCVVPTMTPHPGCAGLNQVACISDSSSNCYYRNQCIDITVNPDAAECTSGYFFTQASCSRIQKSGQTCQWNGSNCIRIGVSTNDSCSLYSSATYSPQVCAAITTANCYWNLGCQTGVAANCGTLGANKLACINATSGNCIFTNLRCYEVTTDNVTSSRCDDPANLNGCVKLNNGQPCAWSGTSCYQLAVFNLACTSYNNVSPGVCARTTGQACYWNNSQCASVPISNAQCTEKGLNLIACITKTAGSRCQFTNNMCKSVTTAEIKDLNCTDNLNHTACLSHPTKCCKWNGTACETAVQYASLGCANLANYSNYCCIDQTSGYCKWSNNVCSTITVQKSKCSDAANRAACNWVSNTCIWVNDVCTPNNKTIWGCDTRLNLELCSLQADFCMYTTECKAGSLEKCSDLTYTSSKTSCKLVYDVPCMSSNTGCTTVTNSSCQSSNLNQLGCIDTTNECTWSSGTCISSPPGSLTACPSGNVSRGRCSKVANCRVELSGYTCISFQMDSNAPKCAELNAVASGNSRVCKQASDAPCMYNSANLRCTTTITGSNCTAAGLNIQGCAYVLNDCYWDYVNVECKQLASNFTLYSCDQIQARYTCLRNKLTSCIWDPIQHICKNYETSQPLIRPVPCSTFGIGQTSPGVCYYYTTDFCSWDSNSGACFTQPLQTTCTAATNPLGCQAVGNSCYWDPETAVCSSLSSASEAAKLKCPQLYYSNRVFCLQPNIEGQTCQWNGKFCISAVVSNVKCTDDLALFACMGVTKEGEACIFSNGACGYASQTSTSCTDDISIYACVAVLSDSQYCRWMGQRCEKLTDDGFKTGTYVLVNANVCRKTWTINGSPSSTLSATGVKYDSHNSSCILSNHETDICTTPGLNYYGCLRTVADSCDWSGSKCIAFVDSTAYTMCSSYQTVSPRVCSQITKQGLKCKQNTSTLSCEDYQPKLDSCTTTGLNREACLGITKEPCVWLNQKCQSYSVLIGIDQCTQLVDVNAFACAQVDFQYQSCKYRGDGRCTSQINPFVERCESLGMNVTACSLVQGQTCVFLDGRCQQYNGPFKECRSLLNVNAEVCRRVDQSGQHCKFSKLLRSCVMTHSADICSQEGLNKQGCTNIQGCLWLADLSQCMCQGLAQVKGLRDCQNFGQAQCIGNCLWKNNVCKLKLCSDFEGPQCSGQVNTQTCLVRNEKCTGFTSCQELFDTDCPKYTVAGRQCQNDPNYAGHCLDPGCETQTLSTCTGNCVWNGSSCRERSCEFLNQTSCFGVYQQKQCYWSGTICIGLSSCQEVSSYLESGKEAEQCAAIVVNSRQCKWMIDKPFSKTYECGSSMCRTLGNSKKNCHGVQFEQELCVILPDFNCVSCDEIRDPCICMQMVGFCKYNSSSAKCQSILCSDMNEEQCEQNKSRCVFQQNQCQQECSKLNQSDCETRAKLQQCYWNSDLKQCFRGASPVVNINTLQSVVTVVSWLRLLSSTALLLLALN